jgi:hypothetical protein
VCQSAKTNRRREGRNVHREEVLDRVGAGLVERQVEDLRHDQANNAEHGNTAVLDLTLLHQVLSQPTLDISAFAGPNLKIARDKAEI